MIIFHTKLNISDNSGGRVGQCIKIFKKKKASIGDIITLVVKKLRRTIKSKKIDKGSISKGIVIRVKKKSLSNLNTYIKFEDNALVLVNSNSLNPIGSRIYGSVPLVLRKQKRNKILNLARVIVN